VWRFPLTALVFAIAAFAACEIAASALLSNLEQLGDFAARLIVSVVEIALLVLLAKVVLPRLGDPPGDYLPLAMVGQLGWGALLGAAVFTAVVALAALFGVYRIDAWNGFGGLPRILIGFAILPGLREELLVRGILFHWLERFGGSWFALALTSALFGLGHYGNPNATVFSSAAIALEAGILLGAAYMLTRNLWLAIGLHAAWNFTQGFIWGVPVSGFDPDGMVVGELSGPELLSGGAFGLEASTISVVLVTAVGGLILVRAVRSGQVVQPWWVRRRLAARDQTKL
jgi:hypothetical protein